MSVFLCHCIIMSFKPNLFFPTSLSGFQIDFEKTLGGQGVCLSVFVLTAEIFSCQLLYISGQRK